MNSSAPLFHIADGCFSYGDHIVLENLNLDIQKGKFYGLIGPNGSGKTTLLDLFMATKKLQGGSIHFKQLPLYQYSKEALAKMLSLVPQDFSMGFAYSVFEVVLMGRHPHIPRFASPSPQDLAIVKNALLEMDIIHLQERSVTDLSGGEKQRVVVARSLAQQTSVLILDEATSSLDIQHTIGIMRVIKQRVRDSNTTVVAAIHDLNLAAAFCDELIVLKDKRIYSRGPVENVLSSDLIKDVFSVTGHIRYDAMNEAPRIDFKLL